MMRDDLQISIGILAHNEEPRIGKTLETLFTQDVFEKFSSEVVIVTNGCTDGTAAVARTSVRDHQAAWSIHGSARVEELTVAGKSNAWNHFVHELSSPRASVLVLMDADIELVNPNTISSMVATLETNSHAVVCVDRPVKDIEINKDRTFFQQLLVAATPEIDRNNVPLCGQLYCAVSDRLRQIELPNDIAGPEDGFLRALLITDGFTGPENQQRIVLDPAATHVFASVATPLELYKHEAWIVTGSIVNVLLFERFWAECTTHRSAMTLMRIWKEENPQWLRLYIQSQAERRGWRLLPRPWWTRRLSRLRGLPISQRIRRFPVAVVATVVDIFIFIAAIRNVRRGQFGEWRHK
jgi:glycosyltransferase involved in cell wall biosynthesis